MNRSKRQRHSKKRPLTAISPDIKEPLTLSVISPLQIQQSWFKGNGLALYILWRKNDVVFLDLPAHDEIWTYHTPINLWTVTKCQWVPDAQSMDDALSLARLLEGCDILHAYLASLPPAQFEVAYAVLHIENVYAAVPDNVIKSMRKQKQYNAQAQKESSAGAIDAALDIVQQHLQLNHSVYNQGWAPGRFTHFDRATGERGWLIISPHESILAGLSLPQVYALIGLLQPRDIDLTYHASFRIAAERYELFYERVMQWNATNDIFETVVQLEALVEDNKKSTDGQLWLNFALAAIGVLLSLFSLSALRTLQIASLVGLVVASICHALYARSGKLFYQVLGWICFALAVLPVIVLLVYK